MSDEFRSLMIRTGNSMLGCSRWVTAHPTEEQSPFALVSNSKDADWLSRNMQASGGTYQAAMMIGLSYAWAESGFPSIQLGHKLAAAFMCTSTAGADVRPPWPGFEIVVPDGLARLNGKPLTRVNVVHRCGEWGWLGRVAGGHGELWQWRKSTSDLEAVSFYRQKDDALSMPFDSEDERTICLLGRLIASVCVAMSDAAGVRRLGKHAGHDPATPAVSPCVRSYEIGRPVEIDCRAMVVQHLRGGKGDSPTVRWMVRGHWRNQACGKDQLDRRLLWIEPHWSGHATGPVVVRPHVIKDESEAR